MRRDHLQRRRGGSVGDNEADILAEATVYNRAWAQSFVAYDAHDVLLDGIHDIKLTGKIAQVMFKTGRGDFPFTRVASGREFTDMTFWERRRHERAEAWAHNSGRGD